MGRLIRTLGFGVWGMGLGGLTWTGRGIGGQAVMGLWGRRGIRGIIMGKVEDRFM